MITVSALIEDLRRIVLSSPSQRSVVASPLDHVAHPCTQTPYTSGQIQSFFLLTNPDSAIPTLCHPLLSGSYCTCLLLHPWGK
jgi:hypothetical protein